MGLDISKVNQIMLDKGINQTEIADKGKINKSVLCRTLKGATQKCNIKTIKKIADGLGVSPIDIVKKGSE